MSSCPCGLVGHPRPLRFRAWFQRRPTRLVDGGLDRRNGRQHLGPNGRAVQRHFLPALPHSCLTDNQYAVADQPTKLVSNLAHSLWDMQRYAQLHVDVQRVLGHVRARDESHPVVHD